MKILITGGNGYIAQSLKNSLSNHNLTLITREDFNLTSREETNFWFENKYFDIVIHTATVGGSRLKEESGETFYQNLQMFYNLYFNKSHYNKFIYFGSGAELGKPSTPYGLSKRIINDLTVNEIGFYNVRIFAVFDENELDTRFIKSNIKRYLNSEPMVIHQDKEMDFFYMGDLITIIKHIIKGDSIPKIIDCTYPHTPKLSDITKIINSLSDHKVPVFILDDTLGRSYKGKSLPSSHIKLEGLASGIKKTFNKISSEY